MTSSRRPSTRRSASVYSRSRQETPPKTFDQTSEGSDLETEESVPSEEDEEETNKLLEDATYQSEEDEMDEEQDMIDEELEEEEEIEQPEPEEDIEEIEQIEDDIEEIDEATPVDDEEDFEAEEESDEVDEDEDEEEDEEQSDYEEETSSRKTRGGAQRSQSLQSQKQQLSSSTVKLAKVQPEKQPVSRKRGSIAESSSSSHGHRILTKRQRAKLSENYQQDLLQLPMEPMKKKHMTEEEIALKKSEIARRRKHQSIQRAEQDKMDTINRLLKKQTNKRRSKDQDDTDSVQNDSNGAFSLPSSTFHYVNTTEGATLSIPVGIEIPIQFEKGPKYPPAVPSCAFPGCNVPKKYCSVKTFEFACSMDHLHKLESNG